MPLSGHDDVALFNDVVNDAESTQKSKNYVIIASLKSETMGKQINRIPGLRLLISNLPGSALRMHFIKRLSPSILFIQSNSQV